MLTCILNAATAIGTFVYGIATVVLAIVACRGLEQWKQTIHGRAQFDTARALLKCIRKVGYLINECRIPTLLPGEASDVPNGPYEDQNEAFIRRQGAAYHERMTKLRAAMLNLQTTAIEAEVLWGSKASEVRNDMQGLYSKLGKAYMVYFPNAIRDIHTGQEKHDDWVEAAHRIILLPEGNDENDEFGIEVQNTIQHSVETIKPYLLLKNQGRLKE